MDVCRNNNSGSVENRMQAGLSGTLEKGREEKAMHDSLSFKHSHVVS